MQVKDVMTRVVELVDPEATVEAVASVMATHGIGFVPVSQADRVVGVLTDRDIAVRVTAKVLDPRTTRARDVMTSSVVSCFDDQQVEDAARLMEREQVHRLVVVNRNDRLVGIVSLDDLARDAGDKELTGEVLEHLARSPRKSAEPYAHIVVTLDGSKVAEQVLPYVETLARKLAATVTLLRAITPLEAVFLGETPTTPQATSGAAVETTAVTKEMRADAVQYLTAIRDRLKEGGLTVECEYPEGRRPAEAIVQRTRHLGADLIAMTTHGRTGLSRTILGSVADEVVRSASCPVLIVHASRES
jgi:nucleotide-binding universal stress UspA family protein/CBS domain-containing protein